MKTIKDLLLIAMAILTVSCAETKQLHEMHDATIEMKDTTKHLDTVSTEMNGKMTEVVDTSKEMKTTMVTKMDAVVDVSEKLLDSTKDLKDTTVTKMEGLSNNMSELYDASRQGGSLTARREGLKALLAARQLDKKVAEAGKYFDSFEFQLFSGMAQDLSEHKKLALLRDATAEFMRDVKEFDDDSLSADPFAMPSASADNYEKSNRAASFNALAAALHILNRKQEEFLKKNPSEKAISMQSLLESSLKMEKDINLGVVSYNEVPEYAKNVLSARDTAVKLIQSRQQFLSLIVLTMISDLKTPAKSWWDFKNYPMVKGGMMALFGWKAKVSHLNLVQLRELSQFLDFIDQSQGFLKSIDVEVETNETLQGMYSNLKTDVQIQGNTIMMSAQQDVLKKLGLLKERIQKSEKKD